MATDTSAQDHDDLKTELRSLLISSAGGCTEQQLRKDYANYNGQKEIPFQQMGYRTLLELLASMPDVAQIQYNRNPVMILGVADSNTAHIKKFVEQQQNKKKRARGSYGQGNGYNRANNYYRPNMPPPYGQSRPPLYPNYPLTQLLNGRNNNGVPFQPYNQILPVGKKTWQPATPSYATATSYPSSSVVNNPTPNVTRQTSTGSNLPPTNKIVASFPPKTTPTPPMPPPPPSSSHASFLLSERISSAATPIMDDSSSVLDDDMTYLEDEELASFDAQQAMVHGDQIVVLRKRIRQLLLKYPNVWLSSVAKLYKKMFDEEFNLEDYKFKNLMVFFDCVSDFADSKRDPLPTSSDRILLLKPALVEAVKREQQAGDKIVPSISLPSFIDNSHTGDANRDSPGLVIHTIDRPIVDLSAFVSPEFHYKRLDYTSNEPFEAFLGDVESPWNMHIGNVQFQPKRGRMMTELQDHYKRSTNQSIYVIPFEQLELNLACVYRHTDDQYYRSYITQIDCTDHSDIVILQLYLVDYGINVSDINYHGQSTNLKFLHKNFSSLATQVYDCRLANISYPGVAQHWSDDIREIILEVCQAQQLFVEIVGHMESAYCIHLWMDSNRQQSVNQLLVKYGYATELDDSFSSESRPMSSRTPLNVKNNTYIDEKLLTRDESNNPEYDGEENNYKHFVISIEHAYYFVKHPFTQRPCLPCFEVARLLNKDEAYVLRLNLVRETKLKLSDSHRSLFDDLQSLPESSKCPHINQNDHSATIVLYDLSSIRDYLTRIKFQDGDVIDAFQREYDNYERPGYWHEKKSTYISQENLQSHQETLSRRRDLLKYRREQLISLSQNHSSVSSKHEMQEIEQQLNNIDEEMHSMNNTRPPVMSTPNSTVRPASTTVKGYNKKMRETLYRIARPFDQQFSLNTRFDHQRINGVNTINADEIEECFEDLCRILKNVIQFFTLESEISNEDQRDLLVQASDLSRELADPRTPPDRRMENYNYCLQIVEYLVPMIRAHVQRTDLLDAV